VLESRKIESGDLPTIDLANRRYNGRTFQAIRCSSRNGQSKVPASPIGQTSSHLLQPCIRLLDLLDAPAEIPFLSGLIHREIVYRLLQYPQGDRLRAIARVDDPGRGTAKALAWLRANYTKLFRLDELAAIARMDVSTLNHHLRATTSLSPLQYHKQLRLVGAREKMLVEGMDATRAALDVRYESTSQFTREYIKSQRNIAS
jgi:AraC-like DNA-binding protein